MKFQKTDQACISLDLNGEPYKLCRNDSLCLKVVENPCLRKLSGEIFGYRTTGSHRLVNVLAGIDGLDYFHSLWYQSFQIVSS